MFLKGHLNEFLEYSSFSQYVFDHKVVDKCQTSHVVFVKKLYCTCKQPDIGEQLNKVMVVTIGFINIVKILKYQQTALIIHLTGSAELVKNCLPYTSTLFLI